MTPALFDEPRFQIFLVGLAAYNATTFLWWELIECRLIPELRSRRGAKREAQLARM